MINLSYRDDNIDIFISVNDWEAVYSVAQRLVDADIGLEYLDYQEGLNVGSFNLNTFEKC